MSPIKENLIELIANMPDKDLEKVEEFIDNMIYSKNKTTMEEAKKLSESGRGFSSIAELKDELEKE